jgi:hypothetical protein
MAFNLAPISGYGLYQVVLPSLAVWAEILASLLCVATYITTNQRFGKRALAAAVVDEMIVEVGERVYAQAVIHPSLLLELAHVSIDRGGRRLCHSSIFVVLFHR